jgi:hypothetical protein
MYRTQGPAPLERADMKLLKTYNLLCGIKGERCCDFSNFGGKLHGTEKHNFNCDDTNDELFHKTFTNIRNETIPYESLLLYAYVSGPAAEEGVQS